MRRIAINISYRLFFLALALVLLYFLPALARLFGDISTGVLVPLLENTIQNMGEIK
jgi:hypothetical protein